jgi:hypothetical protein
MQKYPCKLHFKGNMGAASKSALLGLAIFRIAAISSGSTPIPLDMLLEHPGAQRARHPGFFFIGMVQLETYHVAAWTRIVLTTDLAAGTCTVQANRGKKQSFALTDKTTRGVERLSFRRGARRGIGDGGKVDPTQDVPSLTPATFLLRGAKIRPLQR